MGKQTRPRKSESSSPSSLGKGEVTPRQVAFVVDLYLSNNRFSQTRSVFRSEASSLLSVSPLHQAPKNMLSLEQILNEYVSLKAQKVMVEHDRARLAQEKGRIEKLLLGLQEVMNVYSASQTPPTASVIEATRPPQGVVAVTQLEAPLSTRSPTAGCSYKSPAVQPVCTPSNAIIKQGNVSSPITNGPSTRKRAGLNAVLKSLPDCKRPRTTKEVSGNGRSITNQQGASAISQETTEASSVNAAAAQHHTADGSVVQGSNVAKNLFNQPRLSPPAGSLAIVPTVSSGPNTPQLVASEKEKSVSPTILPPVGNCSSRNTSQDITPTSCTVITSERVIVSPCKNLAYYTIERNQRISSSSPLKTTLNRFTKRDCVKGRLDFDSSDVAVGLDTPNTEENSASESDKDEDILDLDICKLFGANISFTDLLVDLDPGSEELGFSCQPSLGAPTVTVSGSSPDSEENLLVDQVISEFSSNVTEVIKEKDANVQGPDNLTTVKSMTKCIRILSPAKNRQSSSNQETLYQ